jgi:hypothetical protein
LIRILLSPFNITDCPEVAAGSTGGATDEVDTSQIANERLRKAIERKSKVLSGSDM